MNALLLIARLILGLGMAAHGAQKLFGWFGGPGLGGMAGWMDSLGFRPGRLWATLNGLAEFGSGLLIALGLFGPLGPALLVSVMIVAMYTVHRKNGFFAANNGIEVPILYVAGALVICAATPGVYSLDAVLGLDWLWARHIVWHSLLAGVLVGIVPLALRTRAART
jgi:putative oxidoreductase